MCKFVNSAIFKQKNESEPHYYAFLELQADLEPLQKDAAQ
jgi:hypothetical protein